MPETLSIILLWLFIISLGTTFGAGIYESQIVVTRWIDSSPDSVLHWNSDAARRDDTGRKFWAFGTTIPLTLLTLANLVVGWRSAGMLQAWWLCAVLAALAERIFTFFYFIPTMIGLMRMPDSSKAAASALRWAKLSYVRHALVLAAWLAALEVLALLNQQRALSGAFRLSDK